MSFDYTCLIHVRISHFNDVFSGIFKLKASPVEDQSLQQKDRKRRKRKAKKKGRKNKKPEDVGHFLIQK